MENGLHTYLHSVIHITKIGCWDVLCDSLKRLNYFTYYLFFSFLNVLRCSALSCVVLRCPAALSNGNIYGMKNLSGTRRF